MSTDRDMTRIVRSWLRTDEHESADRVLDNVLALLDATPQRRSWWPARRIADMNSVAKLATALAAVVVAAVVGINMLSRPDGPGVVATPSAAAPSSGPSASASPAAPAAVLGPLAPGTYVARPFGNLQVTFTVPEGWEAIGTGGSIVGLSPINDGWQAPDGMGLGWLRVTSLNADPCQWDGADGDITVGPSVADLINALTQQTAYDVSDPADVSLGGYSGKQLDIVFSTGSVAACDEQEYRIWNGNGGFDIYALGPDARWHIWSLDVDGERVVVLAHDYPGTSETDRAMWEAIVQSIRIEP